MERKLIALVLIALLGGIGGGYGIGFAVKQQQFQSDVDGMKTQLDTILAALGNSNGPANVSVTNFPYLTNVNVNNLPVDEQGNLKIAQSNRVQNASITDHATKLVNVVQGLIVGWHTRWYSDWFDIDGYARITVLVHIGTSTNSYILYAGEPSFTTEWQVDQADNFASNLLKTYDVMAPRIKIMVFNDSNGELPIDVSLYLMA